MAGPHVFEDGRVGLMVTDPAPGSLADKLADRLPKIRAFAGGMVTDCFLPRSASSSDLGRVRAADMGAHLWAAVDELSAAQYAARTLADIERAKPGAVELNIELETDAALEPYMRAVVTAIRRKLPSRRLRLNIAPYKGAFLPLDLLAGDPNLYACEQTYYGDLSRVSEGEALLDLLEAGVLMRKASLCYGAAALAGGRLLVAQERVVGLGTLWTWSTGALVRGLRRGIIFSDDLLTDVGLLS